LLGLHHHLTPHWHDKVYWLSVSDVADVARSGDGVHQLLTSVLGGIGAFLLFRYGRRLQVNGLVGVLFAAYIGWIGLTAIWAEDPIVTLRRQVALGLTLAFCAGCVARTNTDTLAVFVAGIAALNLVPAIALEVYDGTFQPFAYGSRFSGTVDPNTQAASLSLGVIVLCWWGWRVHGRARRWLFGAALLLLFFVVLTVSRTSLLALAITAAFSVVVIGVRACKDAAFVVIALILLSSSVACAVALFGAVGGSQASAAMANTIRTDRDVGEVSDLTGRTLVWEACLRVAGDRVMLGFGYGGFWTATRIAAISDDVKWPVTHSHSAYLDQLLALGIPGAILYILLLLSCFVVCVVRFMKQDDAYGAWAAVLLFMMIHSGTESILVTPTFPALVLTLITVNIAMIRESPADIYDQRSHYGCRMHVQPAANAKGCARVAHASAHNN
jgi:O-antigen ligase